MEPRNNSSNWPWRRKMASSLSSSHNRPSTASVSSRSALQIDPASLSFHMYDDRSRAADWGTIPLPDQQDDNSIEAKNYVQLKVQNLTQRLNAALEDLLSKDMMVKQHAKVAEDAVAGWEKAQAEAMALRKELEICLQQKSATERRGAQLEDALKEYSTELRAYHEREQLMNREWSDAKASLEGRLMESEARSSAMAKTLQDRARAIAECREECSRAEAEASAQQAKLESLEMAMAGLRYEMRVQKQEMEMVCKEKEEWNKAAEAARKQNSESARKISKLEADCQRLRVLVKKRLPRPADFARMKMEISAADSLPYLPAAAGAFTNGAGTDHQQTLHHFVHNNNKRMRLRPPPAADGAPHPPVDGKPQPKTYDSVSNSSDKLDSLNVNMNVVMNKLLALEEESRTLKEILSSAGRHPSVPLQPFPAASAAASDSPITSNPPNNILLNRFLLHTSISVSSTDNHRPSDHKSETIDAASCSDLSAVSVINATSLDCKLSSAASDIQMQSFEFSVDPCLHRLNNSRKLHLLDGSVMGQDQLQPPTTLYVPAAEEPREQQQEIDPSAVQRHPVRALASKDIQNQLQSANLICKDAITKLASFKAFWFHDGVLAAAPAEDEEFGAGSRAKSSVPVPTSSAVHETASSLLTEALDMVREVDEILGHMAMAVAASVIIGDVDDTARLRQPQIHDEASDGRYLELLQQQLDETQEELRQAKAELADAKVIIGSLEVKAVGLRREQLIIENQEAAVGGGDAEESQFQLEGEAASLLKLRRHQNDEVAEMAAAEFERRCQINAELECANLQLLQQSRREPQYSASFDEESSEMAAAKEKLVDCQRTIIMLGRQLSALNDQYSNPPPPSDDQSSLDSSTGDGNRTSSIHPDISNNCSSIASMMDRNAVYGSVEGAAGRRSCYADGSAPERGSIIKQICCKAVLVPNDSSSKHLVDSSSNNCGLNILGSHRRMGSTSSEGMKYSVAEHLRMLQEEYNVDSCSSLYSARSSPSVSPSRDVDAVVGLKRQPYHYANPVIRTSLKSSMDRAVAPSDGVNVNGGAAAAKSRGAHPASGFSRFFSRSRK